MYKDGKRYQFSILKDHLHMVLYKTCINGLWYHIEILYFRWASGFVCSPLL